MPVPRLLALALLLLVPVAGCGTDRSAPPDAPPPAPAPAAGQPSRSAEFNAADVAFVRALIPHHEQGIALAELGADKATDPDVRMLAKAIVTTQRDETTRMRGWLTAWRQPAAPSAPAGEPATAGGKSLDRAFLTRLIAHQQEAIKLADREARDGRNINAVSLAEQIQRSRAAEIKQMRAHLAALT